MDQFQAPLTIITFLGIVAITPVWMYYVNSYPGLSTVSTETQFLLTLSLPAVALLFLASHFGGV